MRIKHNPWASDVLNLRGITYRVHERISANDERYPNLTKEWAKKGIIAQLFMTRANGRAIFVVNQLMDGRYDDVTRVDR